MRTVHLLLWVICRVCENAGIDSTLDTILAFDDDAIFISVKKIIVQENTPNSMHKLSVTMSENSPLLCVPSGVK
jgi:hypothetical protein